MKELGWRRAYAVTEYGPKNWWQVPQTAWGAPLEPSSTEKALTYRTAAETFGRDAACVGGYAFKWGWKHQVTPTWICLLNAYEYTLRKHGGPLSGGEETAGVEACATVWRGGTAPKHLAPRLEALTLAGAVAADSVQLARGAVVPARCAATHPQGGALTFCWLVLPEDSKMCKLQRAEGLVMRNDVLAPVPGCVLSQDASGNASIRAPDAPGAYRLFVWVADAHAKLATANVPFAVLPGEAAPAPAPTKAAVPAASPGGAPIMLVAAADGYVRDGQHKREVYNGEATLSSKLPQQLGAGYARTAYVRFDLPPRCAAPRTATLRVYAVNGDKAAVVGVHTVDDTVWDEAALCGAAAPSLAPAALAATRVAAYGAFAAWDVTAAVVAAAAAGAPRVAFALLNTATSEKCNTWASRRGGPDNAPRLELTF